MADRKNAYLYSPQIGKRSKIYRLTLYAKKCNQAMSASIFAMLREFMRITILLASGSIKEQILKNRAFPLLKWQNRQAV